MDAVLRREWLRYQRAMGKAGLVRFVALYVVIFGFVLPNSFDNPAAAFAVFAFIPLYVAGPLAVDAFVGERERNTLETLLTAPFSPAKLLWGKALFPVLVSTATVWLVMLLFSSYRLITGGKLPSVEVVVTVILAGLLTSFLGAVIGLHVSMKAKSVRSGLQWFSVFLLVIALGIPFLLSFLHPYIPLNIILWIKKIFSGGLFSMGSIIIASAVILICSIFWKTLEYRTQNLWKMNL